MHGVHSRWDSLCRISVQPSAGVRGPLDAHVLEGIARRLLIIYFSKWVS